MNWREINENVLKSAILVTMMALTSAANGQTTWTGAGGNDFWFTGANWDTGVVPDGSTFNVIIDAPAPTSVNGSPTVNSLQVGTNGVITTGSSIGFSGSAMNTLTNQGQILLNGNAFLNLHRTVNNSGTISGTGDLLTQSEGATLTGGGTITMENSILSVIGGELDSVLTIEDQTIDGQGNLGGNSIELINESLVDANDPGGQSLRINPAVGGMVNTGTLQASGGGELRIDGTDGGVFDNVGGTIQALDNSRVVLNDGPEIVGGLLTTSGTGVFSLAGFGSPLLTDVSHAGVFEMNGTLRFAGTLNNSGSLFNNNGSLLIEDVDGAILTGGGTLTLDIAAVVGGVPGSILTIEDQTIDGRTGVNSLGNNQIGIINHGLIDANVAGQDLRVNPSNEGVVNTGIMQASGGGILSLNGDAGTTYQNTGGTIHAAADSEVRHAFPGGFEIIGGLLTSSGSGFHNFQRAFVSDVTNTGHCVMLGASNLRMANTFTNSGTISTTGTILAETGDVTLTGGGTITMDGSSVIGGNAGATLAIEDQTIEGRGAIGGGFMGAFAVEFTNSADSLFHANQSGTQLVVFPGGGIDTPWVNEGTLRASNDADLVFRTAVDNNGTIEVDGGDVIGERRIVCTEGSLITGEGFVFANGPTGQSITLAGAVAPGNSAGTLQLTGANSPAGVNVLNVTMTPTAELQIELASASSFDVLEIDGDSISLDGTLSVTLLDGFVPDASDSFRIVASVNGPVDQTGTFNNGSSIVCVSGGGTFDVVYPNASGVASVTLTNFQQGPVVLGDVNLDCLVNLLDVAPFVDRISNGTFQVEADVNEDGLVNLLDVAPFVELLTGG